MKIFLPLLPVLLDRSPASWHLRSALLPVSSSAPSVLRGYDRLRRLLRAFINQSEGSFRMRLVSRLAIFLTAEGVSSSHPRWSPDGKSIAFLSQRNDGQTQVWLLSLRGGEAQRLTDTSQDVDDFAWSPDGRRLVLVLRDASREELEAAKEAKDNEGETLAKEKKKTPKPYVIDRLQFKLDEVGYLDRRR